ncbi:MAG: hypothetical protein EXR07_07310 [Acetobacteraceae bacterium]|nr:hypothetical protein [Acetobacteraceae bacterium]
MFGFLDHAFAALDSAGASYAEPDRTGWLGFLDELHRAGRAAPALFLPRFPDILPAHEMRRFAREPDIAQWPGMMDLRAWRAEQEAGGVPITQLLDNLDATTDRPIEAHLRANGFEELAERTNFCHRDQAHKLRRFLDGSI